MQVNILGIDIIVLDSLNMHTCMYARCILLECIIIITLYNLFRGRQIKVQVDY